MQQLVNIQQPYIPELTDAGLDSTSEVIALNELGEEVSSNIAVERALTIYLDKREIITLMTLGNHPELLILGWLHNQRIIKDIHQLKSVQVDWETDSVAITTHSVVENLDQKLNHKTVTTGCGQGTVFGNMMEELDKIQLAEQRINQSMIYKLLETLSAHNEIYKRAGAVHGCALCRKTQISIFIEDVGRHNAVDAIAGHMWLNRIQGRDKIFYTTGRLTSEMVIKVALMDIPVLLSRSGVTQMGLDIAKKMGVTLIARAKGKHFMVYNGHSTILYDAKPVKLSASTKRTMH
ncbi:MAG: formate dehydrogenase accessory sulfurtransferase FdhD [Gammaproteobacteria bacterium]|jgi:FdhD protein|nr:formate dehydrogenase accessory sulfurtransferase FdhD [Gammaproteobacteria bacterium]MBT3724263.1 formate dehydrogenase accessory sulfurtransferase FdhD [Gammaproteobacteria bacterium]MBT4076541.1 formate dehydrogenase accessory sulfurtransferase FdhD [Gammaproteobacteria bacterium]MBT4193489.1 formate dehydrogenase accessory sulfurtransferase FdhD [Gammaproteobacteria bacterium]MBT4449209.1 formate dehydrogenase accessory sulfurtransferase FdhD [Gammaproteobacteria bacterium]